MGVVIKSSLLAIVSLKGLFEIHGKIFRKQFDIEIRNFRETISREREI